MTLNRRRLLRLSAVGVFGALAGCTGSDDAGTEGGEATPTASPTESATETPTETATETETPTEPATESASKTVSVLNNYFSPIRISIPPGGEIVWSNEATGAYTSHTVTSAKFHESATEWGFDAETSGGGQVSHTFPEAGIYEYYCTLHGNASMCGVVLVGDVALEETLPCE